MAAISFWGQQNGILTAENSSLVLNLQLFAKEGPGGEKTEAATPKRLEDARKEGQVAKSRELGAAVGLLAFFLILKIWVGTLGTQFLELFSFVYTRIPDLTTLVDGDISVKDMTGFVGYILLQMLLMLLPFFGIGLVAGFVVEIVQVKWKPTAKPLMPKFSKLNPVNGFKRMFSKEKLVDLLKSLIKLGLCAYLAYSTLKDELPTLFMLYDMELKAAVRMIGELVIDLGIKISALYLIIGFADYLYQRWKFGEDMKMTKQEVKDEWKNTEGDPAVKGKQRQRMQEASRRRMMQDVPKADVVITNPTHFAVAIKYDPDYLEAPYVLAKGADLIAARIKEIARDNSIDIVENKPLARMLYYDVGLGMPIPPELYQTVAEILAVIYNAKKIS